MNRDRTQSRTIKSTVTKPEKNATQKCEPPPIRIKKHAVLFILAQVKFNTDSKHEEKSSFERQILREDEIPAGYGGQIQQRRSNRQQSPSSGGTGHSDKEQKKHNAFDNRGFGRRHTRWMKLKSSMTILGDFHPILKLNSVSRKVYKYCKVICSKSDHVRVCFFFNQACLGNSSEGFSSRREVDFTLGKTYCH